MNTEKTRFGLGSEVIQKIRRVFGQFPDVEKVVIYGSRALGRYKSGSDIDLCLYGKNLSLERLLTIRCSLDELFLPYKIDTTIYHKIDNEELKDHIDGVGVDIL